MSKPAGMILTNVNNDQDYHRKGPIRFWVEVVAYIHSNVVLPSVFQVEDFQSGLRYIILPAMTSLSLSIEHDGLCYNVYCSAFRNYCLVDFF